MLPKFIIVLLFSWGVISAAEGAGWFTKSNPALIDALAAQKKAEAEDDDDADEKLPVHKLVGENIHGEFTVEYPFVFGEYFLPAMAHLAGQKIDDEIFDLVKFAITNNGDKAFTVIVKTILQGYSEWAKQTITVEPKQTKIVDLTPAFKPEISTIIEQLPSAIEWSIETTDGKTLSTHTQKIILAGRNDIIIGDAEIAQVLSVFITPADPMIENLLDCAYELGLAESFVGYQGEGIESAIEQVKAIYDLLSLLGVRYRSATNNFLGNSGIASQKVFYPRETLASNGANCLDGTVLLAAILERIEMRPFIVLVPGHAFLCVALDKELENPLFIETTMIGSKPQNNNEENENDDGNESEEEFQSTFAAAVEAGTATFTEAQKKGQALLIDVADCRSKGFLPYPYYGKLLEKPVNIRRRFEIHE